MFLRFENVLEKKLQFDLIFDSVKCGIWSTVVSGGKTLECLFTPVITDHSCYNDWLARFSLPNVCKGCPTHHHFHINVNWDQ